MINSKKLIMQAISEIDSLSFEEIEKVIKKIDQEQLMNNLVKDEMIEIKTEYIEDKKYHFNSSAFNYKTVHIKGNVFKRIFKKKDKNEKETLEVAA